MSSLCHGGARKHRRIRPDPPPGRSGATCLQSVHNGEPPKGIYSIVLSPYEDAIKLCDEAIEDKDPPIPELDQTLPAFVKSVKAMTSQLEEMGQYQATKEHKTDKCAKAKTFHATFKTEYVLVAYNAMVDSWNRVKWRGRRRHAAECPTGVRANPKPKH